MRALTDDSSAASASARRMRARAFAVSGAIPGAIFGVILGLILGAMLPAASAAAQTPDLFRPATPADVSAAASADARPKSPVAARDRLLAVERTTLRDLGRTAKVKIALFPDAAATFERTEVERGYGGATVWEGRAGETGSATLVIHDGRITGQVELRGRVYEIAGVGGRAHRVVEVATDRLPPEGPIMRPKETSEGNAETAPDDAEAAADKSRTTIRVNVHFTTAATSDPIGDGNLAIGLANRAYKASGVNIRAKFAAYSVIAYPEASYSWEQTLDNMTYADRPGSSYFADMRAGRDRFKADLVVLIHSKTEYCGLGWFVQRPTRATAGLGFSEVSRDCISNHSVAHEMGHNMGLDHDRFTAGKAPKSRYNFGYVLAAKRVRDIMAYDARCQSRGFSCKRLNRFSTPKKMVKGATFGVPKGKPGAADAARRLNETRKAIAAYR